MLYLSGIYVELWISWLGGGLQKTLKKEENRPKKTLKNVEKEKRRMQRKSNNNNKQFWSTFYIKNYILFESIV